MMNDSAGWRTAFVTALDGTPRFYIALFIVLEAGLGAAVVAIPTPMIQGIALSGMIAVAVLMVAVTARNYEQGGAPEVDVDPDEVNPLWGPGSLPLDDEHVSILKGEWHCEWEARTSTGELEPYVDDTITIIDVDRDRGEFEAVATSTYDEASFYEVNGRVSKSGVAHLYYKFPAPHDRKVGMAILEVSFVNRRAEGWWMGGGRGDDRMVGGLTTWTKADVDEREWEDRVYEMPA